MSEPSAFYSVEELRARLSISTLAFLGFQPVGEGTLAKLADNGIKRIELLETPEQFNMADGASMQHFGRMCSSCGIQVAAYHAFKTDFDHIETEADRVACVDRCKRQIDTLLELGGTVYGNHAKDADAAFRKCYDELARHVEGTDALVVIENFVGEKWYVEDRMTFLDAFDHPQVGFLLDIGHVRDEQGRNPMTIPGGPTRVLEQCGHRLMHVHLHGFVEGADHYPPMCDADEIQWLELFRMLRQVDYPGFMNFEPEAPPRHTTSVEASGRMPERLVALAAETA